MIGSLWFRIVLWAGLAAALVGGLHCWTSRIESRGFERGRAEVQNRWTAADLERSRALLRQAEVNREEEARREAEKVKVSREAAESLRRARADAVAADRAADGLRDQLAAFVARSRADVPAHPVPAAGSPPAVGPVDLLADLFRSSESRAGALAAALDASRAAGLACERSYEALTGSAP